MDNKSVIVEHNTAFLTPGLLTNNRNVDKVDNCNLHNCMDSIIWNMILLQHTFSSEPNFPSICMSKLQKNNATDKRR